MTQTQSLLLIASVALVGAGSFEAFGSSLRDAVDHKTEGSVSAADAPNSAGSNSAAPNSALPGLSASAMASAMAASRAAQRGASLMPWLETQLAKPGHRVDTQLVADLLSDWSESERLQVLNFAKRAARNRGNQPVTLEEIERGIISIRPRDDARNAVNQQLKKLGSEDMTYSPKKLAVWAMFAKHTPTEIESAFAFMVERAHSHGSRRLFQRDFDVALKHLEGKLVSASRRASETAASQAPTRAPADNAVVRAALAAMFGRLSLGDDLHLFKALPRHIYIRGDVDRASGLITDAHEKSGVRLAQYDALSLSSDELSSVLAQARDAAEKDNIPHVIVLSFVAEALVNNNGGRPLTTSSPPAVQFRRDLRGIRGVPVRVIAIGESQVPAPLRGTALLEHIMTAD